MCAGFYSMINSFKISIRVSTKLLILLDFQSLENVNSMCLGKWLRGLLGQTDRRKSCCRLVASYHLSLT